MIVTPEVTPELREEVQRARALPRETLLAMVEPDTFYAGVEESRVAASKTEVWAIIGDLSRVVESVALDIDPSAIAFTAEGYGIPVVEVVAVIAFYEEHRCAFDTRREADRRAFERIRAHGKPVGV